VKDATDKVRAFHVAMGQPTADRPQMLTVERVRLRLALILEEVSELADALGSSGYTVRRIETVIEWLGRDEFKRAQNLTEAADALADISYVVAGTAVEMGIPLGEVFDEVHASNMTKLGGTVREDGKLLKPPGYRPPDIARVLAALEIRREAELARARSPTSGSRSRRSTTTRTAGSIRPCPTSTRSCSTCRPVRPTTNPTTARRSCAPMPSVTRWRSATTA
jgi:predicted HAD superfamily Cof-like phosphohydrolase